MNIVRVLKAAAAPAALALLAPAAQAQQACDLANLQPGLNQNCTIEVGGAARTFDVRVPQTMGPQVATVLDNHGFTSTKEAQARISGLTALVDENLMVMISPQGIGNSWNARGSNGNICCGDALNSQTDDIAFFRAAVSAVEQSLNFTPSVRASSGLSNGSAISNRVACEAGDMFDLVAGVSFPLGDLTGCTPRAGTIYAEFHGTADAVVPFAGFPVIGAAPASEVPQPFAQLRGCDMTPAMSTLNSNTMCQTFSGCAGGGFVQMCTTQNGQHVLYPNIGAPDEPDFADAFRTLLMQTIELKRSSAPAAN
jgi:polyhydroxybutyrate depolymerase